MDSYSSNNMDSSDSITDINSMIDYIKKNFIQILLLLLVIVIIYIVDFVTNMNATIYGVQQVVPGLAAQSPNTAEKTKPKIKSKLKSKKK